MYKDNKHKHILLKSFNETQQHADKAQVRTDTKTWVTKNRHKMRRFIIIIISDVVQTRITKTKTKT